VSGTAGYERGVWQEWHRSRSTSQSAKGGFTQATASSKPRRCIPHSLNDVLRFFLFALLRSQPIMRFSVLLLGRVLELFERHQADIAQCLIQTHVAIKLRLPLID
jgi:hypothetical protein